MSGFKKAVRSSAKLKILVIGPSGSGKTLGALQIADGIAPEKVAFIDSENERSAFYADRVNFDSMSLPPERQRPAHYITAIDDAVKAGYEIVVIDSLSHAWLDLLARKEQYDRDNPRSNSWGNWRTFGPEWDKLIRHILEVPVHVIATARSKQAYEQTENNGKKTVEKMGLQPILRENTEYEFALVFDLFPTHKARATKDNTGRFSTSETDLYDLCSPKVVTALQSWLSGAPPAPAKSAAEPVAPAAPSAAPARAATATPARPVRTPTLEVARATLMPFGRSKGRPLADVPVEDLRKARAWAEDNGRQYPEFFAASAVVLAHAGEGDSTDAPAPLQPTDKQIEHLTKLLSSHHFEDSERLELVDSVQDRASCAAAIDKAQATIKERDKAERAKNRPMSDSGRGDDIIGPENEPADESELQPEGAL